MTPPTKFTQEIKDKWLDALRSGKYKQGFFSLTDNNKSRHCCIGVLGDCIEGLNNNCKSIYPENPYIFLDTTIGRKARVELHDTNDIESRNENYPCDYSNVIPLIQKLPVQS